MGLFNKKRTTQSVGQEIGRDIRAAEQEEKNLRTLRKEEEVRLRREKAAAEIRAIKQRKPTKFKKFVATVSKVGARTAPVRKAFAKKAIRRTNRSIGVRRTTRRAPVRRAPVRRAAAPKRNPNQLFDSPFGM